MDKRQIFPIFQFCMAKRLCRIFSQSKVDAVTNYIRNQKEHHTKKNFKEELVEFLKSYQVEYKEEYLWS